MKATSIEKGSTQQKDDNSTTTTVPKPKETLVKRSMKDALAGASAGAISKTLIAPIERVKLVMQLRFSIENSNQNKKSKIKLPSTAWGVAKNIYHEEGFLAFWRGNTPNVIRQGGGAALNFMLMDWYKAAIIPILKYSSLMVVQHPQGSDINNNHNNHVDLLIVEKRQKMFSSFLSGGLAGGTTTTILYPIEFLRTRLALDVGSTTSSSSSLSSTTRKGNGEVIMKQTRKYPGGMKDVFISIWKTDGIRGMYQGYGTALSGVVLYRALHLGGFDACKTELLYRRQQQQQQSSQLDNSTVTISLGEKFLMAQFVSIVAGTICYPIDSVRRRLMMQAGLPASERLYRDSIHAYRRIFMDEGMRGFYLGFGPNLIRTVGGAIVLVAYDMFSEQLGFL